MRSWIHGIILLFALAASTTAQESPAPLDVEIPDPAEVASSAPMARVNGQVLPMTDLHAALVADYGLPIAQQFIADAVVRQALEAQELPVEVTQEDIDRETVRAMSRLFTFEQEMTDEQRDALLRQFLAKNNYTRRQWTQTMARNARLARLAKPRVTVTEDDLRDEFLRQFEGRLRVRHIQVPTLDKAMEVMDKLQAGDADFAAVALEYSTHADAKDGAWLPEIRTNGPTQDVPTSISQAALALQQPGDVSNPVQAGTNYHILKLEEILPPVDAKFQDVKPLLEPIVRSRRISQLQQAILQQLIREAEIEFLNPSLRTQDQQRQDETSGATPHE
jgi:parvulin-like peptidyl-prolyl isomerase